MRHEVCYNHGRVVRTQSKRLIALKEGFSVRNGNSLKAFGDRMGEISPYAEEDGRWRAGFPLFFISRKG